MDEPKKLRDGSVFFEKCNSVDEYLKLTKSLLNIGYQQRGPVPIKTDLSSIAIGEGAEIRVFPHLVSEDHTLSQKQVDYFIRGYNR